MNNFLALYEAGGVKRWHTKLTIKEQDLASHSWGVAMVLLQIAPDRPQLLRAALVHDLHEVEAGDIPYPFKRNNAVVRDAYTKQEREFAEAHGEDYPVLLEDDEHLLKWADMFELLLWAKREIMMGNSYLLNTRSVAIAALNRMGAPNKAAADLLNEALHD